MSELSVAIDVASAPSIAEKYLDDPEISCMVELKRWLLDELKRPTESVVGIDMDVTMLEKPSTDGIFKQLQPGRYIIITLTFDDGDKAAMTFDKQKEAKKA